MTVQRWFLLLLMLTALVVGVWRGAKPVSPPPFTPAHPGEKARLSDALLAPFQPLPVKPGALPLEAQGEQAKAQVALGRMLFFEKRLSKNHDVSCNSCHGLSTYGVDNQPLSLGHRQQRGRRNSPTVYNAAHHVAQFWDGRAATLEEQALGPLLNPVEMAMGAPERILKTLRSMPEYRTRFAQAFADDKHPLRMANVAKALAAFERKLLTPSRFDRYLQGDTPALAPAERRGLQLFTTVGCTTCHNGPAVGGTSFQKLGLVEPYPHEEDLGRFEVTKDEEDRLKFRVPTLRNVAKTAPYFHNGDVQELSTAVRLMGKHQLGKTFTPEEVADLVAFLNSLTGTLPEALIEPPPLPPSTAATPKPDPS